MRAPNIKPIARRYRVNTHANGSVRLFHTVRKLERFIATNAERIGYARARIDTAKGILEEFNARAALAKHVAVQAQADADLAALEEWAHFYDAFFQSLLEPALPDTSPKPATKPNGTGPNCPAYYDILKVTDGIPPGSPTQSSLGVALSRLNQLLDAGLKMHAIKLYRHATGDDLRAAKHAVEQLAARRRSNNSIGA